VALPSNVTSDTESPLRIVLRTRSFSEVMNASTRKPGSLNSSMKRTSVRRWLG
jgi:hypothetical protein